MTETVTIEVVADVKDAKEGMSELRTDLKKTQKESKKTKSIFSDMGKDIGALSPGLGKVAQGIGRLSQSYKRIGAESGGEGNGTVSSGLGRLASNPKFRKGVGIAGLALTGTALLKNILGGQDNKLASFDKLNNLGQSTLMDFLDTHLRKIRNLLGEGGAGDAVDVLNANPAMRLLEVAGLDAKSIGNTIGTWFDSATASSTAIFNGITASVTAIGGIIGSWFDGLYSEGDRIFNHISDLATDILDTVKGWFNQGEMGLPETPENPNAGVESESGRTTVLTGRSDLIQDGIDKAGDILESAKNWLDDPMDDWMDGINGNITDRTSTTTNGDAIANSVEALSMLIPAGGVINAVSKGISALSKSSTVAKIGEALSSSSVVSKVSSALGDAYGSLAKAGGDTVNSIAKFFGLSGFANGGVFEPNKPQLAILGDNKTEPEVAAPKSMISAAVKDAITSSSSGAGGLGTMGNQSSEPINITLEIDGRTLARVLYDPLNNESVRRNGVGMI